MQHGAVLVERVHALAGRRAAAAAAATAAAPATAAQASGLGTLDVLWRDGPVVAAAALDRVRAHPVDPVEELLAEPRRDVEDGVVRGDGVVDRLPEVPFHRL